MRKLIVNLTLLLIVTGYDSVGIARSVTNFDEAKSAGNFNAFQDDRLLAATVETVKYSTAGGTIGTVHGLSYRSGSGYVLGAVTGSVLKACAGVRQGVKDQEAGARQRLEGIVVHYRLSGVPHWKTIITISCNLLHGSVCKKCLSF